MIIFSQICKVGKLENHLKELVKIRMYPFTAQRAAHENIDYFQSNLQSWKTEKSTMFSCRAARWAVKGYINALVLLERGY